MKTPAIIGIDNGLSGGIVALCPESGALIDKTVMPLREFLGKDEADVGEVVRWVSHFDCRGVGIEEPPKHLNSIQSMRSMCLSFGLIAGALQQGGYAPCRITVQEWQKALLGKVPQGQTKPAALAKARELWPDEQWLPSRRHRTPHDGMVDAALIARYLAGWLEK
jgi:hypothetical protein